MIPEDKQLKDLTIIIASHEIVDGVVIVGTRTYHYDLQGATDEFIKLMENLKSTKTPKGFIVEGGRISHDTME